MSQHSNMLHRHVSGRWRKVQTHTKRGTQIAATIQYCECVRVVE